MAVSFGIYLGNTSCCVAVHKNGNCDVVANPSGDRVTPAMVAFSGSEVVAGIPAKQGLIRNGSNSIVGVLRTLGSVSEEDLVFPLNHKCQVVWEKKKPKFAYQHEDKNLVISAENVLEHIMLMLKDIAISHSSVDDLPAVITLPSWVSEKVSSIVQKVATLVGFTVHSVITQPSALTLAYDLLHSNQENMNILMLHCGGSSVVASLAEISGGLLIVRESSPPSSVAGDSLTLVMVDHFAKEFYMRYKGDPLENRRSKRKLYNASENCKHVLSTMNTAQIHVESLWEGVDFSAPLSRARFDGLVLPTLQQFLAPVRELLDRCGVSSDQISKVILSGGSCKIPKLQRIVSDKFPRAQILKKFPPDEALALGAAVEASLFTANGFRSPVSASTRLVSSISVPIYALISGESEASQCVFTRGTPTHAKNSVAFEDLNFPCNLIIYESEQPCHLPSDKQILAQVELQFCSEGQTRIQADFSIKSDGSLHVKIQDPKTKLVKTSFLIEAER